MNGKAIRLSLDVSPDLNEMLEKMANKSHSSKSDILRKSIALMEVAVTEKAKGNHLGVVNEDRKIIKDIVGL